MALYEPFFVITKIKDEYGDNYEETLGIKTIDISRIEDFGPADGDEERTVVTMFSGKEYLLAYNHIDFGNFIMEEIDGLGKLLKFNLN